MFCQNCGNQLEDSAKFCDSCGASVAADYVVDNVVVSDYSDATQKNTPPKQAKCWSVFAKISKILGIISIALCWIPFVVVCSTGPVGIVFGCLGNVAKDDVSRKNKTIGLTLSIIGSIVSFIAYFVLLFALAESAKTFLYY